MPGDARWPHLAPLAVAVDAAVRPGEVEAVAGGLPEGAEPAGGEHGGLGGWRSEEVVWIRVDEGRVELYGSRRWCVCARC